jgi:hypothetical protein
VRNNLRLAEKKQAAVDEMNEEEELYESSVSISDPAADVLCDLSMLRPLEEKLKSVKTVHRYPLLLRCSIERLLSTLT